MRYFAFILILALMLICSTSVVAEEDLSGEESLEPSKGTFIIPEPDSQEDIIPEEEEEQEPEIDLLIQTLE